MDANRRIVPFSTLVDQRRQGVFFMKGSTPVVLLLVLCLLIFVPAEGTTGAEKPAPGNQPAGEAVVTLLEGMVSLLDNTGKPIRPLSAGDRCRPGDRFRIGNKARLSLKLSDGTCVRFSDFTTAELISLNVTDAPEQRNLKIKLLAGDAWVNAAMPYTGEGTVTIFVPHAVIDMTQGICRLTVFSDNSSLVKVYRERIQVRHFKAPASGSASNGSNRSGHPKGDKTAWNHLLKTMYQLYIRPDGSATNPFRFMVKSDETEWVLWNQEQDKRIGAPAE
jgi:hypothetical protein